VSSRISRSSEFHCWRHCCFFFCFHGHLCSTYLLSFFFPNFGLRFRATSCRSIRGLTSFRSNRLALVIASGANDLTCAIRHVFKCWLLYYICAFQKLHYENIFGLFYFTVFYSAINDKSIAFSFLNHPELFTMIFNFIFVFRVLLSFWDSLGMDSWLQSYHVWDFVVQDSNVKDLIALKVTMDADLSW